MYEVKSTSVLVGCLGLESGTTRSHDIPTLARTCADSSSLVLGVFSADGGTYSRDVMLTLSLSGVLRAATRRQEQHIGFPQAADKIKVDLFLTARFPHVM